MAKFNVGDQVRYIGGGKYVLPEGTLSNGRKGRSDVGTVVSVDTSGLVKVDFGGVNFFGEGTPTIPLCFNPVDLFALRLVKPAAKPTGLALVVLNHLKRTSTISVQEGFNDHGLSGGHLTKIISNLRKAGYKIDRKFRKHPVTGKRYARYYFFPSEQIAANDNNKKAA